MTLDLSKVLAAAGKLNNRESVQNIRLCDISRDESQPRTVFDDQSLLELATDIEQHGLLQPIIVREESEGKYVIIAGERRYRAFSLLNKPEIPCIVRNIASDEVGNVGYMQMSENLKRDDLRFYEVAEFIESRVVKGDGRDLISKKLGISVKDVSYYLSWSKAPDWLKQYKNRFSTIRAFCDFAQFAKKEDEEALKEFMSSSDAEKFTSSMLKQLKAKSSEAQDADDATVLPSEDTSSDEAQSLDSNNESFDAQSSEQDESYESSSNDDASADDANESNESDFDTEEQGSDYDVEDSSSHEDQESDDSAEVASDDSYTESDDDFTSYEDEATDAKSFDDSPDSNELFKKPIILGYVDDREAELLYRTKVNTDGFVLVKYEDGTEAETLAENFKLNRIIEG